LPNTPFLCHFVDSVSDNSNRYYSTDFREFLVNKLKILPKDRHFSDKSVLILSTHVDHEADIVCIELLRKGIDYVRLNVEDIPYTLSITNSVDQDSDTDCKIKLESRIINLSDISAVWLRDFDYELDHSNSNDLSTTFIFQQWSDALQILCSTLEHGWINSLEATYRSNNRVKQLTYANKAGFNIPSTLITNDPKRARSFYRDHNGDIILKVLHHHNIEVNNRVYSIYSHRVTDNDLLRFNDLIYAPCILQERVQKSSELRVTVVKDKVFSVQLGSETLPSSCDDIHRIPLTKLPKRPIQLEKKIELRCIKLTESLGLVYGAIDFVIDEDGKLFFLEVNPTGDWLWIERETKLPITKAVVDLIEHTLNDSD
jgi:glutathione synthase/RimK-type ligase-like ATP-grasp enzyme